MAKHESRDRLFHASVLKLGLRSCGRFRAAKGKMCNPRVADRRQSSRQLYPNFDSTLPARVLRTEPTDPAEHTAP